MRQPGAPEAGRRRGHAWALPASLLAAIVLPVAILAALVWVFPRPDSGFAAAVRPVGLPVQTGTDTGLVAAVASLKWRGGPALHAPAWSGLVTEVRAHPGDKLVTGSPVVVIDGVTRIAVASSTPFYRTLSEGDSGADVTMLRQALGALGLGSYGTKPTFDGRLRDAVGRLAARLGGDRNTTAFDPSWFVFLPTTDLTVGAVKLPAAQPAPATGEEIVTSQSVLAGVTVGAPSTDADTGSRLPAAGLAPFPDSGDGYVFAPDSDPKLAIRLSADFTATGSLTPLAAITSSSDTTVPGTVRLVKPREVSTVATTALVTGPRGRTCVYPYGTNAAALKPVAVEVVGGEPGITKIAPIELQQVLANPAALSGLATCR